MSVQRAAPVGFTHGGDTGRYGNVLHQYAAAIGLARKMGTEPILGPVDWPYRSWLNLPAEWFPDPPPPVTPPERFARVLSPRARPYLQALSLWSNAADEIRSVFSPSVQAMPLVDEAWATLAHLPEPRCAVHIRRGDVLRRNPSDSINVLPASYYRDAVDEAGCASVVCFTDDVPWVRSELPADWHVYEGVPGPEDYEPDYGSRPRVDWIDVALMAGCDSAVISNSSFGWWGAWIGQCETYFPSRWYGGRLLAQGFDVSLILPPHWTRVETE